MRLNGYLLCMSAVWLNGCALQDALITHTKRVSDSGSELEQRIDRFKMTTQNPQLRREAQSVNKPWIAGKAVPLAKEVSLPQALQRNVDSTFLFGNTRFTLSTLAERLSTALDLPVRISPEALLPSSMFAPRLASIGQNELNTELTETSFPRGSQPLARILDLVSRRLNVSWRYDTDTLVFYRTETQVFDVRLLTTAASVEMALGRTNTSSAGGFDSSARTVLKAAESNALEAVKAKIEPFLTRAGVVSAQAGAAGSIVVTDMPASLKRIAQFLDKENRLLTRRVRLVFEELTVETDDSQDFSVDWSASSVSGQLMTSLKGASADLSSEAAQAAMSLATSGINPVKLMLQALSRQGKVIRHSTIPIMTINRRPVTHAVRTTFSYIDQVRANSATSTEAKTTHSSPDSVSVSQKEETVGTFLTILPDAQDDGQILLSIAYDNTSAQPLKTISFGESGRGLSIQQIVIDGTGTVQQVSLRSGQSMLISGFERVNEQSESTSLTPDVSPLLGGADRLGKNKVITVIVLTALLEEG